MKNHKRVLELRVRALTAMALVALATQGCGAADVDEATGAVAAEDSIATTEEALHAFPGVPALPWRGAPPQPAQLTSNQAGLQLIYHMGVGVTNKTIVGLQVCWYTPSNANNFYTQGDPLGCTIVGKPIAGQWTAQACPGDQVVSGYSTRANAANTKIVKFGTTCKSLSNPSVFTNFPILGDPNVLFSDHLHCQGPNGQVAYMEYFNSNNNLTGFNGVCVLQ